MMRLIALVGTFAVTAAACGDSVGVRPTGPGDVPLPPGACGDSVPTTEFSSPDAFDQSGCTPGAFADFDPTGTYFLDEEIDGFVLAHTRIDPVECGIEVNQGIVVSRPKAYTQFTDDALFWRTEVESDNARFVEAVSLCSIDEDGTLRGTKAVCQVFDGGTGEQNCGTVEAVLRPFGRIEAEAEGAGLELVGELFGEWPSPDTIPVNVRVADDGIAYLATFRDGLRIIDVSDAASPVELGHFPVTDDVINDVKIVERATDAKRFVLLASGQQGVLSVDVSDPTAPKLAAAFSIMNNGTGVHTLFVEPVGDEVFAYLAGGGVPVVSIFDVTDPQAPVSVGQYTTRLDTGVHDLMVRAGVMYLCATDGGFEVVDSNVSRTSPELLGFIDRPDGLFEFSHSVWVDRVGDRLIAVEGGEGLGTHARIIDVDPQSDEFMTVLGTYQTRREVSIHNVQVIGDKAYIAYYQDGVRVIDLTAPNAPAEAAYFNTWRAEQSQGAMFEGAIGIDTHVDTGLIYVADRDRGLVVLRFAEQANRTAEGDARERRVGRDTWATDRR